MAEEEEDFSSLPLPDRFVHKVGHDPAPVSRVKLKSHRIGRFGKEDMKMPRKNSRLRQMNRILLSDPSYLIRACGRELCWTRMLPRNRRVSQHCAPF